MLTAYLTLTEKLKNKAQKIKSAEKLTDLLNKTATSSSLLVSSFYSELLNIDIKEFFPILTKVVEKYADSTKAELDLAEILTDFVFNSSFAESSKEIAETFELPFKTWVRLSRPVTTHIRVDHDSLNNTTLPINSFFVLKGTKIYGPHDYKNLPEPSEWINCHHQLLYSRATKTQDLKKSILKNIIRKV